jgi:hypothetical protein
MIGLIPPNCNFMFYIPQTNVSNTLFNNRNSSIGEGIYLPSNSICVHSGYLAWHDPSSERLDTFEF